MKKNIALITGGSRGIGAATALLLARNGFAVCINYLNAQDKAEILVDSIKRANGKAIAVQADMSSENDILRLFNTVDKELGPITALINNAGTNGGISEVENITTDCLHHVFATNVYGTFLACREAIKRMKPHNFGNIVNVSSTAANFGGTNMAHYSSSKAAINTFTIACAREVAGCGIRVNAVSPGVIDTDMHSTSSPDRIANLLKTLPMKRMGKSEEVAELIHWLVSDASSYVSGAIIPVTGSR